NVSAKDLGTGKEQKITITASSGLDEEEIERMVKEAEKFAEEDKKRKELVEARNEADALIYSTEKTMRELGGKIDQSKKEQVEAVIKKLKETAEKDDVAAIKRVQEELSSHLHELSSKLYEEAKRQQQQAGQKTEKQAGDHKGDGEVVDADYEVVDDEEKENKK
ncbi:MAG: Hsp70 family protein, partial [Firmicutes bacterium]|nr:Hsp70 family protein [Bacillota bacterium]